MRRNVQLASIVMNVLIFVHWSVSENNKLGAQIRDILLNDNKTKFIKITNGNKFYAYWTQHMRKCKKKTTIDLYVCTTSS